MHEWEFARRRNMSTQRDPVYEEFFTGGEAINASSALVREAVQNSLDAASRDTECVRVRIHASGLAGALESVKAKKYFDGLPGHLTASKVTPNAQQLVDQPCRYVVVEDFGTTGLTGKVDEFEEPQTGGNHFYYFFRAEGKSGKTASERGRWGVGKYVFPMTSEINTFFAMTRRAVTGESTRLLMGKAILRNHYMEKQGYEPDGWWAHVEDETPLPIEDSEIVQDFCTDWDVLRTDNETGTSIVIPYVRDDVDFASLGNAVVAEYHLAVLSGRLEVSLSEPGAAVSLDTASLFDLVASLSEDAAKAELITKDLRLFQWYRSRIGSIPTVTFPAGRAPKWSDATLDASDLEALRAELIESGRVAIRVLMHIQKGSEPTREGYVTVVLEERPSSKVPAAYYREGILLSKEQEASKIHGVRALVLVEEPSAAGMLGDAENPAHTKWSGTTGKFVGKYRYGASWLRVVRDSPQQILKRLRGDSDEPDTNIARDFFNVSRAGTGKPGRAGEGGSEGPITPPTPPAEKKPAIFRVDGTAGSVKIRLGKNDQARGVKQLSGRIAYDVRKGNPFQKYRSEDFNLTDMPVGRLGSGWVVFTAGNNFTVDVEDPDLFELEICGFDPNRDVIVNAWPEEMQ